MECIDCGCTLRTLREESQGRCDLCQYALENNISITFWAYCERCAKQMLVTHFKRNKPAGFCLDCAMAGVHR